MRRVMIVGPNACLSDTIETLHSMGVLHFTDTNISEGGIFSEGKPMKGASESSYRLLKIRAAKQILKPLREASQERYGEEEIDKEMDSVMSAVEEILDAFKRKQVLLDRIRYLEERKAEIEPLSRFPVPLEHYRGLDSVEAFVGTVIRPVEADLRNVTSRFELFSSEDGKFIALFVDRRFSAEVRSLLSLFEFKEFRVPESSGSPAGRVEELDLELRKLRDDMENLESTIDGMSVKDSALLNAAEEVVSASVSKAEAPLHFSVTEREFVATGWVPAEDLERLTSALQDSSTGRVFVTEEEFKMPEERGVDGAETVTEDTPPVKLRNVSVSRPYELLVRLFSLPNYGEYDPTIVVAVTFALFVGLMINDLGYGILMIILGYILVLYFRDSRDMRQLAYILITSGAVGAVFGVFVFGLAFGVPITATPLLDPANFHVAEGLLLICVIIGLVHMGIGYGFRLSEGVWTRETRKVLSSAGWLAVLVGFVTIVAGAGKNNIPIGSFIWHYIFFWAGGPAIAVSTLSVPDYSIALIIAGLLMLVVTEGGLAIIESISLLANVISYVRLAAIAIAGAALAGAINMMLMPHSFAENPLMFIAGLLTLILAQIFVFIMLTLSASIQALRLNYIEFFVKFFKGGGRAYTPFGMSRKYTTGR